MKSDSRSLIELRNLARVSFQIYIRQRDKDLPCISCNKSDAKWDAGHYLKAEIYTKLIFNEDNIHKQCSYCNLQLAGNLIELLTSSISLNCLSLSLYIFLANVKDGSFGNLVKYDLINLVTNSFLIIFLFLVYNFLLR